LHIRRREGLKQVPCQLKTRNCFVLIQVCTFNDGCKQGIDQQIFNRKSISRKITHPQSLFKIRLPALAIIFLIWVIWNNTHSFIQIKIWPFLHAFHIHSSGNKRLYFTQGMLPPPWYQHGAGKFLQIWYIFLFERLSLVMYEILVIL